MNKIKNTNPIISRQDYYFTQPCPSEQKQTNKQKFEQISPCTKLTHTTGPTLGGQKPKGKKNSTLKLGKDLKHNKLKLNNNVKVEKYCTKEGTS